MCNMKLLDCLSHMKLAFVGDSMIAELFVGVGDIVSNSNSTHNFRNWVDRWDTARMYKKRLKKQHLSLPLNYHIYG